MIRVQGLHKRFGSQAVLRGLDLDIATGEIMVVIVRSGGGKSVLLKHLIGLLRPDAGAVLVDGTDITRLRGGALDRVRERYGVVFQGGALFDSMSVFDNVAFPLREKSRRTAAEITGRVEEKLEQVGLAGMGGVDAKTFSGLGENIAALCDVDSTILEKRGFEVLHIDECGGLKTTQEVAGCFD